VSRITLNHTAWDMHQHDARLLPDGSIAVGEGELLDLKARLWLNHNAKESAQGHASDEVTA